MTEYNDPDYYRDIRNNGAAGAFFVCGATKRILLAHRSEWVETPFHWSGFGGAISDGESPEQAARREISEEAGYHGNYELVKAYRFTNGDFSYQNFVAFVDEEFAPELQWENTEANWFSFDDLPRPIHPGMAKCLADQTTMSIIKHHFGLTESFDEIYSNPNNIDPALLTFHEYRAVVDPNQKSHPSSAYDVGLEELNSYFDITEFPKIIKRAMVNGLPFEFRLELDKNKYTKERIGSEIVYFSDEEIKTLGYPKYTYSIAVVNEDGQRVASLQDEWGSVLIMTAREYRGFGFGKVLGKMAYTIQPDKPSGGFTPAGFRMFKAIYREFVSDALRSGRYRELIKNNMLTYEKVKEIIASANLEYKPVIKRELSSRDPRDWFLYGTDSSFILYDKKFAKEYEDDRWGDSMLKGMIHFGIIERSNQQCGIVYIFGGEKPTIKTLLLRCAASVIEQDNATLMVDMQDAQYLDPKFFNIGKPNKITGYERIPVTLKEPFSVAAMVLQEQRFRQFDKYDEFLSVLVERAEAKFRN